MTAQESYSELDPGAAHCAVSECEVSTVGDHHAEEQSCYVAEAQKVKGKWGCCHLAPAADELIVDATAACLL